MAFSERSVFAGAALTLLASVVYMEVSAGVTVCSDPDSYVWWDEYHPTRVVSLCL